MIKPSKVTITGIDGNGGRQYRVHFGPDWVTFCSMPGDKQLYCGSTATRVNLPETEARMAAELVVGRLKRHEYGEIMLSNAE